MTVIDVWSRRLRRADVGPIVGVSNDQVHVGVSLHTRPGEGILGDHDAIDRRWMGCYSYHVDLDPSM